MFGYYFFKFGKHLSLILTVFMLIRGWSGCDFGKCVSIRFKTFTPMLVFILQENGEVEPGNGPSSTIFLAGGLGWWDGGLKFKLVLVTTFL
jgi:hypothetical protein